MEKEFTVYPSSVASEKCNLTTCQFRKLFLDYPSDKPKAIPTIPHKYALYSPSQEFVGKDELLWKLGKLSHMAKSVQDLQNLLIRKYVEVQILLNERKKSMCLNPSDLYMLKCMTYKSQEIEWIKKKELYISAVIDLAGQHPSDILKKIISTLRENMKIPESQISDIHFYLSGGPDSEGTEEIFSKLGTETIRLRNELQSHRTDVSSKLVELLKSKSNMALIYPQVR